MLGEGADAIIGETDIVAQLLRNLLGRGLDLGLADDAQAFPTVELAGVFESLLLAAFFDLVQHPRHGGAHVVFAGLGRAFRFFQVGDGHFGLLPIVRAAPSKRATAT